MAQNCPSLQAPITIKLEPTEKSRTCASESCTSANLLMCTCSVDKNSITSDPSKCIVSSSGDNKKGKDILVNFGLNRKKVITLRSEDDDLHELFCNYMRQEPAFSKLLDDSYVVFQEFNGKFGTFVDIDDCKNLTDGSIINAVFFPKMIERDEGNPSSVKLQKRKMEPEKQKKAVLKTVCEKKQILEIDLSSESEDTNNTVENCSHVTMQNSKKSRRKVTQSEKSMVSDVTSPQTNLTKGKKSKRKDNKSSNDNKNNTEKESEIDRGFEDERSSSNTASLSNSSKRVYMPILEQHPNIASTSMTNVAVWNKSSVSPRDTSSYRRNENTPSSQISSLHHADAISQNKNYNTQRNKFPSPPLIDRSGKVTYPYNDAPLVLEKLMITESEHAPIYLMRTARNNGAISLISCKLRVKHIYFVGSGENMMAAKSAAAVKALAYFCPDIKIERNTYSKSGYEKDDAHKNNQQHWNYRSPSYRYKKKHE